MRFNKKLILLIFFTNILSLFAQSFVIDKLGMDKGLSDNYILSIAQDQDGLMWFGTEWGLNRFDGQTFKVYKVNSTSNNTVSHNGINKILTDSVDNSIWIATKEGGLNMYNSTTQQFTHYPVFSDALNSTKANGITDLCFDKDGDIWIATYKMGLKKLDKKTNTITHNYLTNITLKSGFKIKCIQDDHNGHLYVGHWGNGFSALSTKDFKGKHYDFDPHSPNTLPDKVVLDIFIDSHKNIWLATHSGLALFHPDKETFTVFRNQKNNPNGLTSSDIHTITEINNKLWIGTWQGGINILDLETADLSNPENVSFEHIVSNDLPSGLSSPSVEDIFRDSFGNVWIAASGGGINVISHNKPFFNHLSYSPVKGEKDGLSSKDVNNLAYDEKGLLWVGFENAYVDIYNDNSGRNNLQKLKTIFIDDYVICSLIDSKENVWFGRNTGGLVHYNRKTEEIKEVDVFRITHWAKYVASLFEDTMHNIWISTNNGIIKYNPYQKSIQEYSGKPIGLTDNFIRTIIQDINGNFWIGSEINGVSVVTPDFKLIHHFDAGNVLKSNIINYICEDSKNQIWICTKNGLTVFPHVKNNNYDLFTLDESKGISDNYIRAIAEGQKGEMWISTNTGISRYVEQTGKIENFDYNDGIPYGTFKNGAVAKSPNGNIYFGSQNGICYFNSNDSLSKQVLPPTIIANLHVYDSKEDSPDKYINLPVKKDIKLTYSQNTIYIDFSVVDYALRNQVEYSYMMKGINDKTWFRTNSLNHVTFRNLSPGNYTFYVRARMHNQEWSYQMASIYFTITPPYWLSWWAKLIYVLIAGLLLAPIVQFYRRKLKLENQLYLQKQSHLQELEINKERLQFFTNITHELRTPLTLILGPLEDLLNKKNRNTAENKQLSLIYKNATRLFNLINQLMEFRKSEGSNRKLSVSKDDITIHLQEIVQKYKELNQHKEVSIDLFVESIESLFFDKEVITIIMDNLISNALKNTLKGAVNIIVRENTTNNNRMLEIEVNDTGTGIPEDALDKIFDRYYQVKREKQVQGTGIGLALVKNLVQLHKGAIDVKSKINEGTTFYVRFNINESYPEAVHNQTPSSPKTAIKKEFKKQLLIVEDNEDILEYISEMFSDSFEILTAKDGQEGSLIATEKIPDIIISDIMMPIMDGIELCKTLKGNVQTSHIPIILLTAKDSEADKAEGYSIGADSYLTKPFSANLLQTRVANLLEGRVKIADYFKSGTYKKEVASKAMSDLDRQFINKTIAIVEENLGQEQISISFLAKQQNMSYSSFFRKLKAITGMTANEFVRDIKLQNAEKLLLTAKYSISEVAFMVGYNSMAYFRESFKSKFGMLPSQYLQSLEKK